MQTELHYYSFMDDTAPHAAPARPTLAQLEHRALRSTVTDGAAELLLGMFLIAFAIHTMTDSYSYLYIVVFVLAVPIWKKLRRDYVEPRVGAIRLGDTRIARIRFTKRFAVIGACLLLLIVLGTVVFDAPWRELLHNQKAMLLAILFSIPMVAAGLAFRSPRFFVHAGGLLASSGLSVAGLFPLGVALMISGALIGAWGGIRLILLIWQHPVGVMEIDTHGE